MRSRLLALSLGAGAVVLVLSPVLLGTSAAFRTMSLFFLSLAIMAGLHVVTGLARAVSLCHAALIGVGAYAGALASMRLHLWPGFALLAGAGAAAGTALVLAWATRRLEDHYLAFATLAFSEIVANVFRGATPVTGGANGLIGVPPLSLSGFELDGPRRYYWVCVAVGCGAFAFVWALDRSAVGRALRAYGDQGIRVESLGVSAPGLRVLAFTLGGGLAGLVGAITAHTDGFVGPESYGIGLSIAYLCFLVIGGLGWLPGIVVAAVFASIGPELFRHLLAWQMIIVSAAAITVLYVRSDFASRAAGGPLRFARVHAARSKPITAGEP
jgi:branched-chain amino acid transport system permease protein